jgi:hypothetical protein
MPARARSRVGIRVTSFPPKRILPVLGLATPEIMFTSVDLPAPLGPMTATSSPLPICRLMSARIVAPPIVQPTSWTSMAAGGLSVATPLGPATLSSDPAGAVDSVT